MEEQFNINASRIPAAQPEGSPFAVFVFLCLRVRQLQEEDKEEEGDITEEGEDAEEQRVRILHVLLFAERFNSRDET